MPQISYPPPDDHNGNCFSAPKVTLSSSRINDCLPSHFEGLNCLETIGGLGAIQTFPSPIDSTSSSASIGEPLHIAGIVEGGEPQDRDVPSWGATGANEFAVFEVLEPLGYDCVNRSALDYSLDYETFTFGGLSEEGSNILADQYL